MRVLFDQGTPVPLRRAFAARTAYANLFLNTGHGTLGWTMACGSGRLVADVVSGNEPEVSLDDLGIERFG